MPHSSIQILLVEDNEGDIFLTVQAIEDFRFLNDVAVVRDGAEAINYVEKRDQYLNVRTPDLILLDINLPKKNGFEVLAHIKSSEKHKYIPVVVFTTSSSQSDILKSYRSQASSYITKPVLADDFMRAIWAIEDFYTVTSSLPNLQR